MERVSFHNAHHFVYGNMVHTKYKADFFLRHMWHIYFLHRNILY